MIYKKNIFDTFFAILYNMNNCVDAYNRHVKTMSRLIVKKTAGTPDEWEFYRNNSRLSTLISADPIYLIKNTGQYLLEYAEPIKKQNWAAFREVSIEDSVNKNHQQLGNEKSTVLEMLTKIPQLVEKMSDNEAAVLSTSISGMLDTYCDFVRILSAAN
jgi:cytolysin (calcineurin-like family phosphatase)